MTQMLSTTLKHNKKRNVGLINEFFARYIAKAIIEHRDSDINKAKFVFRKHFRKGTDLHRELRLFETLYNTKTTDRTAAMELIKQAQNACKLESQHRIELEKTALLHEINSTLADPDFFNQNVADYKTYGTIQVLMNHWRSSNSINENLSETFQLQEKLVDHITSKNNEIKKQDVLEMTNEDIDGLVINIMVEKLNAKFGKLLSEEQKSILNLYVFSNENLESKAQLATTLENVKQRVGRLLEKEIQKTTDKTTSQKLSEVQEMLQGEYGNVANVSDNTISFYLSALKLETELNDAAP